MVEYAMFEPSSTVRVVRGDARCLDTVATESVDLVVTSPPYWQIKDYAVQNQIGYGQSLHEYLYDLSRVWSECARVLRPGRRLCINIGDQFARALIYGRYKIIPLHAEVIAQCASLGLDFLGSIIWQKKTTMQTSGGAVIMGSFPYPPNGIVELDYEYILLFKKPGLTKKLSFVHGAHEVFSSTPPKPTPEQKQQSELTKDEWKQYFAGHWTFGGARQVGHEAMFPDELPLRLIRMFSFVGETVLDPFLGSGTTAKVAADLGRNAIGYEINPDFVPLIRQKVGLWPILVEEQQSDISPVPAPKSYVPSVEEARPVRDVKQFRFGTGETYKVTEIVNAETLCLDTGLCISLLGIRVPPPQTEATLTYLRKYLLGKAVLLQFVGTATTEDSVPVPAYVQLTNKLFVNRKMIEMGLAIADLTVEHRHKTKFLTAQRLYSEKGKTE